MVEGSNGKDSNVLMKLGKRSPIPLGFLLLSIVGVWQLAVFVNEIKLMREKLDRVMTKEEFGYWVREHKALVGPIESAKIPEPPK